MKKMKEKCLLMCDVMSQLSRFFFAQFFQCILFILRKFKKIIALFIIYRSTPKRKNSKNLAGGHSTDSKNKNRIKKKS